MRLKSVWLLSGILVVGFVVLATPASPTTINTCSWICNCAVSCATECEYSGLEGVWPERYWVVWAYDCGGYGLCSGLGSCGGQPANCPAQACTTTWNGTAGGDTKFGGAAHECLNGLGGNDTIDGGAGDDTIHGNDGTDTLYGNSGNDCLYGGADNDHLDGQSGTDLADGGAGTDTCTAEATANCP